MNPAGWDREVLRKKLIQLLVFLAPTQLALHFWPNWSLVFGLRVDYLSITLYLTDLIILLYLFLFLSRRPKISKKTGLSFLFLLFLAFTNTLFADNQLASIFRWIKFFEYALLVWAISKEKNLLLEKWLARPFVASLILFSAIGILQFMLGRTLGGPLYFLGERSFSTATPGVSLISFLGEEKLRAYSTFSHPNSLGAYLLVSSLLTYPFLKIRRFWKAVLVAVPLIAFFLTFSKGTWITAIFLIPLFFLRKIVFRKGSVIPKTILVSTILLGFALPVFTHKAFMEGLPENLTERLFLAETAFRALSQNPVLGTGMANFYNFLASSYSSGTIWLIQPVHNIFLLVLVETGLVGLVLFTLLLWIALEKISVISGKKVSLSLALALLAIILTGFSDHHWITLQQNQILFSLVLGLAFKKGFSSERE